MQTGAQSTRLEQTGRAARQRASASLSHTTTIRKRVNGRRGYIYWAGHSDQVCVGVARRNDTKADKEQVADESEMKWLL